MTILKLSEIVGFAYIKYVTKSFVTSFDLKSKTFELFLFRDLTCSSAKKMQVFTSSFISFENRYVLMLRRYRFITISLYHVYLYLNILEIMSKHDN